MFGRDVLLFDEPTSAFDDQSEQFFFEQLDLIKAKQNINSGNPF